MFSGISPASLLLVLLIVVLVFGTTKLKGLGSDVGGAIKGFRKAMNDDEKADAAQISSDETTSGGESVKQSADSSTKS